MNNEGRNDDEESKLPLASASSDGNMVEQEKNQPSVVPSAASPRMSRAELLATPPPSGTYRLHKSRNHIENQSSTEDPNSPVPLPPPLRRASSTPGAYHGGGSRGSSQTIGELIALEGSNAAVLDFPSMLPLTPETTMGAISSLSGTITTPITATLVTTCSLDELEDHTGEPTGSGYEGHENGTVGGDIVYAHAQPLKGVCLSLSRRSLILGALVLVLGIVGLSVGLTLSSRSGGASPKSPGDPFVDSSLLPSGTPIFGVQWGASSQCDNVDFAPLELSCDSNHSVYILLPNASQSSVPPPPLPLCARRGTMVECLQSNANTSSLQAVCLLSSESQTIAPVESSSRFLSASLAESTIEECNKVLKSTAYFDYYGGVTATYLHVQRVCDPGESSTVSSTPPSCSEGKVWALTPFDQVTLETSTTTPFLCARSNACIPETVCLANSTTQCAHALCENSSPIQMEANESSYCLDSTATLPPYSTLVQELTSSQRNSTETLDQQAILAVFPFHAFHQVVLGESGAGFTNESNDSCNIAAPYLCPGTSRTTFRVTCGNGAIVLLENSNELQCNQTNITALECVVQNVSSNSLLIACAGNAPQDLTAVVQDLDNVAEPSVARCTEKIGSWKASSSVEYYGGVAGYVVGVGQLCREAGDELSSNSTTVVYDSCDVRQGAFCSYMSSCSNSCTQNCSCSSLNDTTISSCTCPSLYNATSCTCHTGASVECGCQMDIPRFGRIVSTVEDPACLFNATQASQQLLQLSYASNDLVSASQGVLAGELQKAWNDMSNRLDRGSCMYFPNDPPSPISRS